MANLRLLFLTLLLLPGLAPAQSEAIASLPGVDIGRFCQNTWTDQRELDQRRYMACVQEQQQALARIQGFQSRFSRQQFYRGIALPYCRSTQNSENGLNLVPLSFCLEDEISGYREIQTLRQRYGSSRVDKETSEALAASGSWAAAASQVKRATGLKSIRQGAAT